jgi:hypothetical protein
VNKKISVKKTTLNPMKKVDKMQIRRMRFEVEDKDIKQTKFVKMQGVQGKSLGTCVMEVASRGLWVPESLREEGKEEEIC